MIETSPSQPKERTVFANLETLKSHLMFDSAMLFQQLQICSFLYSLLVMVMSYCGHYTYRIGGEHIIPKPGAFICCSSLHSSGFGLCSRFTNLAAGICCLSSTGALVRSATDVGSQFPFIFIPKVKSGLCSETRQVFPHQNIQLCACRSLSH